MKRRGMGAVKVFRPKLLAALLLAALWAAGAGPAEAGPADLKPGGFIVFAAGDRAQRSLMVFDPAVGRPSPLADSPGVMDTQPAVGPSGQLAWIRQNGPDWDLVENGRVLGTGAMYLSPAYLPDGTLAAAVSGEAETSIFAFGPSGARTLLAAGGEEGLAVSPAFSPDGGRMAYVSNQSGLASIFVAELTAGGRGRAITSGPERATDPDWSPRGDYLVFVSGEKDICLIRPDGGGLRRLTAGQGLNRDPVFSPDGSAIAFTSDRDGYWRLYVMDLDGQNQRPLLPGVTVNQHLPAWSAAAPQKPASAP